jgi:hypothetical protein
MAITNFDKVSCRILSRDIEAALGAVASRHGIIVKPGRGTYTGGHFTLKIECSTVGQDGVVNSKEAEDFKTYATLHDLQPEDLGKTVTFSFEKYTITGMRPKATRFPILAKRVRDGKVYCLPVDGVRRSLEQQEPGRGKRQEASVRQTTVDGIPATLVDPRTGLEPING